MYYIIGFLIMCLCIILGLVCIIASIDQAIQNRKTGQRWKDFNKRYEYKNGQWEKRNKK